MKRWSESYIAGMLEAATEHKRIEDRMTALKAKEAYAGLTQMELHEWTALASEWVDSAGLMGEYGLADLPN